MTPRPRQGRSGDRRRASAQRARTRVDEAKRQGAYDRLSLGGEIVVGRQAVRELLRAANRRVRDIWLIDEHDDAGILAEIEERASEASVVIHRVSREKLQSECRTESAQGVLAHAVPLVDRDLDEVIGQKRENPPFFLVVDGVTDPHNLGALLRTANISGADAVVVSKHRAAHVTPTVTKAAAGAIEYLDFSMVSGIPSALERMREKGIWTVGLDGEAKQSVFGLTLADQPIAVVVGSEGKGLSPLALQRCDVVVSIPQYGAIESLNVSVAGALAMYEIARGRNAG